MTPAERTDLIQEIRREYQQRNFFTARVRCEQLLSKARKDAEVLYLMGSIHHAERQMDKAAPFLERAATIAPKNIGILMALARVQTYRPGKLKAALRRVDAALKLEPDLLDAIQVKGQILDMLGDRDAARALLEPAAQKFPDAPDVGYYLARTLHGLGERDAAIAMLRHHIEHSTHTPPQRRRLGFQLGQYLERAGDPDGAFEAYQQTNDGAGVVYDAAAYRRQIDETIEVFNAEFMAGATRANHGLDQPVLIVGMPRTGSTLLEQILDRHPMVQGVGENRSMLTVIDELPLNVESIKPYPQLVHDMTRDEMNRAGESYVNGLFPGPARKPKRLVDKALVNFENIGLLSMIVPDARVLDCRRDPVNTCLSCYTSDLDVDTYAFASGLESLGAHYRQYERMMNHWHRVDTASMMRVQYEELVDDLEGIARQVLEFLDLPWDAKCLSFYESKTAAVTLSNEQVRQPIYKRSVDRAGPFGKHLDPLRQALSDEATTPA